MKITETDAGNRFELDGGIVAVLSDDPMNSTPLIVRDDETAFALTQRQSAVAAHAALSLLRAHIESPDDDRAFERTLRWLESFATCKETT